MRTIVLLLAGLLVACSTTSAIHTPYRPPAGEHYQLIFINRGGDDVQGIARLENVLRNYLEVAGLIDDEAEGSIEVTLTHYYMRSNSARFWVGVMAGRDKIESTVRILDGEGVERGRFNVSSTNATALGSTGTLQENHAEEILRRLR